MAPSRVFLGGAASLSLLASAHRAYAADCYVDSVNGSDSNNGTSSTTPVESQAAIPSGCTAIHYARGSQFNEAMKVISSATTYTNYGDSSNAIPDFKLPKGTAGSVFQTFNANITIDGLKFEGSHNITDGGNGSVSSFDSGSGICVYLQGQNSIIRNSEVTDCDFGIMLQGDGSVATNNYVHDVNGQALDGSTSSDPNSVGGGKGIYAIANNVEVAYNTIINCVTFPQWTGADGSPKGGCDGGATEIAIQSGATLTGYKNHHNFAYYTCGFFQASTTAGSTGTFENSEFYDNVMIDTAWMILAQVNNTNFVNMKWENNTVVQHAGAGATADQGILMEMWNGLSSGVSGGSTPANQIFLTNNLMVLEGVNDFYDFNAAWSGSDLAVNTNVVTQNNIFLNNTSANPGFVNIGDGMSVPSPGDFDLTSDTVTLTNSMPSAQQTGNISMISQGTPISGLDLDFLNRVVPSPTTGNTDIGAFQYDSVTSDSGAPPPATGAIDGGGSGAIATDAGSASAGTDASVGNGSGTSGGPSGSASSGTGQTSGTAPNSAVAPANRPSSGCGCRLTGDSTAPGLSGVLLGFAGYGVWVRRRRRRS